MVPFALDIGRPREFGGVVDGSIGKFRVFIVKPLGPFGYTHQCPIHEPRPAQSVFDTYGASDGTCHGISLSATAISQKYCRTANVGGVGSHVYGTKESSEIVGAHAVRAPGPLARS